MNDGLINDCFIHDRDRLRHDDALAILRERLRPVVGSETVPLSRAFGRILAENAFAPHDIPLHTNAAVDGYAFAHADLGSSPLPVSMRVPAGVRNCGPLKRGTVARIFTGAPMPEGADTVAMQEDCRLEGEDVVLPTSIKRGANCRAAGEDLKSGALAVSTGTRLKPAHVAALASIGQFDVPVRKHLVVAILSSGDELRRPDDGDRAFEPGDVWDANTPMLQALLATLPVDVRHPVHLRDDAAAVRRGLLEAADGADLILSTGGASRGEEDHMRATLDSLGKRHIWQLAVKPGRPMVMGQIARAGKSDCVFIGLPGNPVAAMVCFLLYARAAILHLSGARHTAIQAVDALAGFEIEKKKPDRREFLRGWLERDAEGRLVAVPYPRTGSGLISSLTSATGLIDIQEETTEVERGDVVRFLPFDAFS